MAAQNLADPAKRPLTGEEYLDSLRDGREVWIYGERVKDVTTHPAFRNSARMMARLYDSLHDPAQQAVLTRPTDTGSGGYTHRFFRVSRSAEEMVADRDAIAAWARMTYGWMGRSPDFKAALLATLNINAEMFAPYQANAKRWHKDVQEKVLFFNHAIINPPMDRNKSADQIDDVVMHVEKETDKGIVVSGAKVVATGSALTFGSVIASYAPVNKPEYAAVFLAPMDTPGIKLLCRHSYAMTADVMGSPFDYPLASRLDENDAIFIFDKALIPWECVLVYRDVDKHNGILGRTGYPPRFMLQGCTRMAVKLDFISGLLLKALDATGAGSFRGVQAQVGEVLAYRNLFWALSDSMARTPVPWKDGAVLPNDVYGHAYRVFSTVAYPRVKEIIEQVVASGLIYLNSNAVDFKVPEIRGYLEKYVRGSGGYDAESRVKVMKLLWDAIGSEFGGRHELYERNYAGNHEVVRMEAFFAAQASGLTDSYKKLADQCMSEYDLNGWKVPDMISPNDINLFAKKF